ncbi:hypothetical protein lerEdw1_004415 [Lerista edwardsae]|nr:hypothetical protein lerEdw1_004415 [Lerista edwardsae]
MKCCPENEILRYILTANALGLVEKAEARLAAKRAARAEAREIRMKELERQQKEIYQVQKASDEDEHMSVGSRGSIRTDPDYASTYAVANGCEEDMYGLSQNRKPSRVEEKPEKDFEKGVRTVSSLSAATLASLGGTSSRRGSGDTSISVDTEASIREIKDINELKDQIQDVEGKYMQGLKEIKDSLAEAEEKYKKAMVSNAQLDNEKTNFMYQVDALKDALLELEEQLAESRRQYEEKNKDFEREKHAHMILQFQFTEVKEALKNREELLTALERQKEFFDSIRSERDDLREEVTVLKEQLKQHGIVPNPEVATNGETSSAHDDGLSSKIVPCYAFKEAGEDILGRANEVEMKDEILENVGKKELLQNTEHEEHSEETKEQEIVQKCLAIKTLHADGNAEAEKITEGKVASTLILSSGLEEQVKGHSKHVSEVICSLENSGVAELRNEGGLLSDTTEGEESEQADHENIIDNNQNKVAVLGTESNSEVNIGLEKTFQQQNNEKQKGILTDEAEGSNEEVFQEALEFVTNNHVAISSQLTLAEDTLTDVPCIDSNIEQPYNNERENTEGKVAASDLKRQLVEDKGDNKITDKAQWDKNGAGEIKGNETENEVQEQETEVVASASEQAETCSSDHIQDGFVEEQKQVEEIQFLSSKHNSFVEEEQNEQEMKESESNPKRSLAKESDKKEALFRDFDLRSDSEKNNEKNTMQEVPAEQTVADVVSLGKCWTGNEKDLEDNCKKCDEIKSEFTDDDTLANTQTMHDTDDSGEEEYNPTQTEDCLIGEQNVHKPDETIQDLPETTQMGKVHKGAEEAKNYSEAEKEVLEFVPDIQEAACPTTQKAKFSDQVGKPDSEEEEVSEEYHEAFDFDESSFGELNTTERRSNSQDKEGETNNRMQEGAGIAESAEQNVITDNCEKECRDKTNVTEGNEKITYQKSADEVVNDDAFTEGEENIQQGKMKESEEAKCLETDPFVESPKLISKLSEDPDKKLSDEISVKEVVECTSEQLKRLGSSVDENPEEVQVGRKGKGKSREDCVIS